MNPRRSKEAAELSADSHGIDRLCTVFLTEKAWRLFGAKQMDPERAVPCSVDGNFVQFFTTFGFFQVLRSEGGIIRKCIKL